MKGKPGSKPPAKDFLNNPFRDLKGLPVRAVPTSAPSTVPPPTPMAAAPEVDDAPDLFSVAMHRLGVRQRAAAQPRTPPPSEPPAGDDGPEDSGEAELFLEALGQLNVNFQDHLPEEDVVAMPRTQPRRMRQLQQGRLVPEANLDLHGMSRAQALERVRWFLQDAVFQGLRTVLIVTGRGRNSPQGPVLREAIGHYLAGGGEGLVGEWGMAPARFGGEGALVVFLRGSDGAIEGEPER